MKTILFVEQNQDNTVGGSHYCLLHLINSLNKEMFKPIVMFYEDSAISKKFNIGGCSITVFRKPFGKCFNPPYAFLRFPSLIVMKLYNLTNVSLLPLFNFIRYIIRNDIDLIHLNNSASVGWEWLVASKLLGRKCITHERGWPKYSRLQKMRGKYFDKIICVSKAVEELVSDQGLRKKAVTIYDGMDIDGFRRRRKKSVEDVKKEFGVTDARYIIGMVGNFQAWKGQLIVIKALDILKERLNDFVCIFIGDVSDTSKRDREYFEEIKNEIKIRKLEKKVIITGYRSDVPNLINVCDIMIHSSIEPEPFGMVVLEAMSLGKPIIASELGGPKEIIENEVSGILIPPGNSNILAEKIEYLLRRPEVRNTVGENAARRVMNKFSLTKFADDINQLYEALFVRAF